MNPLKQIRAEHKLNQEQMAKKISVSYSHYVKLENGFVNPSFTVLTRIKQIFPEMDMNDFFK